MTVIDTIHILRYHKGISFNRKQMECTNCKKQITSRGKSGKCKSCVQLGNKRGRGRKHTTEERLKQSQNRMSEKNPMWKGESVGYFQLHAWVKKRLPKTQVCQCCQSSPPIDLANKGTYDRELHNWEWLCRRCHMTKDGRIKNLKQFKSK